MKKSTLLLLSSALFLGACSQTTTTSSSASSDTSSTTSVAQASSTEETTTAAPVINYEDKYKTVFEDFRTLKQNYWMKPNEFYEVLTFREFADSNQLIRESYSKILYAFEDINHDGISEMIIVNTLENQSLQLLAIFALKDNQPILFAQTASSPNGGDRYISTLLSNGNVLIDNHSSGTGEGTARIISLEKETNTITESERQPIEHFEIPYDALGISKNDEFDLSSLEWHSFIRKPDANQVSKMDLAALQQGDFTSVKGTWENELGMIVSFDEKGLTSSPGMAVSLNNAKLEDNYLKAYEHPINGGAGGSMIWFIPAGVVIPTNQFGKSDGSDSQFDRILAGQDLGSIDKAEYYYYRVSDE